MALAILVASACATAPPAPATGPRFPDLPVPTIPDALTASPDVRDRQALAWRKLQAGDLRGATRDYSEVLKRSPAFYPAETGLGLAALADRQFKPAASHFRSVLGRDNRYLPAWRGLVEAELGAGNDDEAVGALERLLAIDNRREEDRARLELLRLRQVQALVQSGVRARESGRLDEAAALLSRALSLAASSAIVLRELALVEVQQNRLTEAEAHARRAVASDPNDASAHGALAAVLDARGRPADATAALARAAAIDPAWRARAEAARARADEAVVPEIKDVAAAASVTRGQLAALIGTRLEAVVARSPRRLTEVATDARGHWAARWIMAVTQAGIMDVLPNHTFQPAAAVRRADLADAVGELLALVVKPDQLAQWQRARPAFADVSASNLFYRPAALAVTATAMSAEGGRFQPTRPATGADVLAALARLEALAGSPGGR